MDTNKSKPKYNMGQNVWFMIRQAFKVRRTVLYLCLAVSLTAVATNMTELFIAPSVLAKVESTAQLPELLATILFWIAILMLCRTLAAYIDSNTLAGRIEIRLTLVQAVHRKFSTTSYPNTENPDTIKKLEQCLSSMNGNSSASEAIWETLTNLLQYLLGFTIYLNLLSHLDPILICVILTTTLAGFFFNKRIRMWDYNHREEQAQYIKELGYINNRASDIPLGKDMRIFGMRSWIEDSYQSVRRLYEAFTQRREKEYLWGNVLEVIFTLARNGISYGYLIAAVFSDRLSAAEFLLYFTAATGFTTWINGILREFSTLHQFSLELSNIREFLELPEIFAYEEGTPLICDPNGIYEFRLDHVSFRYPGAESDALHDINLTLKPGEKLAIVGLNGAGKTTLVKLLCGFYDPTDGRVLLNGQDIRQYNRRDYYRLFSAVFQQFSVLEATLAENVSQQYMNIDKKQVIDCLSKAGLSEKLSSLPAGLDTHIGRKVFEDGVEFSGGELQRLMLARSLYKNAPVVLLDEPTAALDPIAESDIYSKYNEMMHGRSSVFISHRLASTRFCDRIIFLDNGRITEEGTHYSLMDSSGSYAHLFHVQSEYYQQGGTGDEEA